MTWAVFTGRVHGFVSEVREETKAKILGRHWRCASCQVPVSSIKALEAHAKRSTRLSFECKKPDCNKRFAKYDSYHRHLATHKSQKAFGCEFCDRKGIEGFNRKPDLDSHMKTNPQRRMGSTPGRVPQKLHRGWMYACADVERIRDRSQVLEPYA
jgi:hypothetical protein